MTARMAEWLRSKRQPAVSDISRVRFPRRTSDLNVCATYHCDTHLFVDKFHCSHYLSNEFRKANKLFILLLI